MKKYCNKHYTMYEQATGCLDCCASDSNIPQKDAFFSKGLNIVLGNRLQGKTTFCYAALYHNLVGSPKLGQYPLGFQGNTINIGNNSVKNLSTFGLPSSWRYSNFFWLCVPIGSLALKSSSPKFIVVDLPRVLDPEEIECLATFGLKYDVAVVITHNYEPGAIFPYPRLSNVLDIRRIGDTWSIERIYKGKHTNLYLNVSSDWGTVTIY